MPVEIKKREKDTKFFKRMFCRISKLLLINEVEIHILYFNCYYKQINIIYQVLFLRYYLQNFHYFPIA